MGKREEADLKKAEGNEFFKKKQYEPAIDAYSQAIAIDPSNHVYFSNRAAAYLGQNNYELAKADAEQCVAINSKFVKGYHRLALALNGLHQYVKALQVLKQGQKADFNNKDLNKLILETEPLAAKQEQAERSGLSRSELLKLDGNTAFKNAQFDQAIEFYSQALELEQDKTSTLAVSCYNNRAACYQQMSNYSQVIADCSMVLEADPKNQKALLRRGLAYEGLERYRLALQDIRELLAINPNVDIANRAQHRIGNAVRTLKKQAA